ncbi:hypothetical protein BKA82DRAFT_25679 [Pisolithus tinctorius]|uniref:Uncharacterized protein n=1 Tax=Pisolithus tinctorius Marx 270 TaxID=870435 RepID=A0A0C3K634_PISTI|nr:hypothetical protein BKA82DRAFT_25679 [Pisolithus tinctorius]KIO05052.1 hypothetical protein M404DRAFT_25679 [Pisolithus tinctorius Marx 270]
MSFLPSPDHPLGTDLWTDDLQALIKSRANIRELQQWECFPTSLTQLVEWATVAQHPTCTDRRRSHLIIYKTLPVPEPCGVLYPVSVRIYSFLDKFCVGEFGNWTGDCAKAAYAVQSLSISGTRNTIAWRNQLECLNLAATFASHVLKIPLPAKQFRGHVHMQRKVFTKDLHPPDDQVTPPVNSAPQNAHLPKLPDYPWVWNGPVKILECNRDGTISPIHKVLLSQGHFVEIDAEFDLVVVRTHTSRTHLRVFLTCKQILHLQSARSVQASGTAWPPSSYTEIKRMRANATTDDHHGTLQFSLVPCEPGCPSSSQVPGSFAE